MWFPPVGGQELPQPLAIRIGINTPVSQQVRKFNSLYVFSVNALSSSTVQGNAGFCMWAPGSPTPGAPQGLAGFTACCVHRRCLAAFPLSLILNLFLLRISFVLLSPVMVLLLPTHACCFVRATLLEGLEGLPDVWQTEFLQEACFLVPHQRLHPFFSL